MVVGPVYMQVSVCLWYVPVYACSHIYVRVQELCVHLCVHPEKTGWPGRTSGTYALGHSRNPLGAGSWSLGWGG